jgi:hypothetical protein
MDKMDKVGNLEMTNSQNNFVCNHCDYVTSYLSEYTRHCSTSKHTKLAKKLENSQENQEKNQDIINDNITHQNYTNNRTIIDCDVNVAKNSQMTNKKNQETINAAKSSSFYCSYCDYTTNRSNDYKKHEQTQKHKQSVQDSKNKTTCTTCGKHYTTSSGLWKHKEKCNGNQVANQDDVITKRDLFNLLNKRDEIMSKKDEDFRALILEVVKATQVTNSHNTMTNSHNTTINNPVNNSFNINFFLNETCKEAMNLSEFIQTIKSNLNEIEKIGQLGYVDGLSEMIIQNLNAIGINKRPIHCTDAKRETMYVKENNMWNKEDEALNLIQNMINEVQRINLRQLPLWREKHPTCTRSDSMHTEVYNNMSQELMGGDCRKVKIATKDEKIISKIAKSVTVNKKISY